MEKLLKFYVKAQTKITSKLRSEEGNWVGTLGGILITVLFIALVWTFIKGQWGSSWSGKLNEKIEGLFNLG